MNAIDEAPEACSPRRTPRSLRSAAAALLLSLGLGPMLVSCETAPISGRSQLILLSPGEEVKLGLQAYQEILKKEKISTDPEKTALLARVGARIAAATGRTDFQWEFRLIENDKVVNAFCLPGGKVAVYTGILPITRDEAGLAAVIGHEIAHATARHGAERMSQGLLVQAGLTAGAIAAGASGRDSASTQALLGALGAGATLGVILPFSRLQETEADRLGLTYMARAGYDPRAARDLWVRMADASAKMGRSTPEWMSTHPSNASRIRDIEAMLPEALAIYKPR
ncbi:MAG: M48 family metallopeptidase [Betaproteobacteria bacterium]|nr:M48 family metallopeptidase [Betaproteobacteria bacterium]